MELDDAAVLKASLDNPSVFSELFARHHRVIWIYLARLAGDDAADDLAGEVFTAAFANRSRYDNERGEVRSWLYGIAANHLRMRHRTEGRRRRAFIRAATQRDVEPDPVDQIDDGLVLAQCRRAVIDAMAALSSRDREVLTLYAWEGLSYEEVARALDVPVGTVRSRLARARQRLAGLVNEDNLTRAVTPKEWR